MCVFVYVYIKKKFVFNIKCYTMSEDTIAIH